MKCKYCDLELKPEKQNKFKNALYKVTCCGVTMYGRTPEEAEYCMNRYYENLSKVPARG